MARCYGKIVFFMAFLTMLAIAIELFSASMIYGRLFNQKEVFSSTSKTAVIASSDAKFVPNELKAAKKRLIKCIYGILEHLLLLMVFLSFTVAAARKHLFTAAGYRFNMLPSQTNNPYIVEVNYLCILFYCIFTFIYLVPTYKMLVKEISSGIATVLIIAAIYTVAIPYSVLFVYKLFQHHGRKVIIICYAAFFLKAISEFIDQETVDLSKMRRVPVSEFSERVQIFLAETGLTNKIYKEKVPSNQVNAALVGWGKQEHIEIYGNHKGFTTEEFEAILMHEIGHSKDKSLYKKLGMLFALKILEMVALVYIFSVVTPKYVDAPISLCGAFLVLAAFYFLVIHPWLFIAHRITSQAAELSSDIIAKNQHYGNDLATVLYKISISASDFIFSTLVFNFLYSYHPSVYRRVEYLANSDVS
ncbi:STE24 endopeptidase [Enteropsectra breve]|nr:STE24 endopeptidase [Enteropsectra breve]